MKDTTRIHPRAPRLLALLLLLLPAWAAAIPASYEFRGIGDYLLRTESGFISDPFTELYTERDLSVASAINNNGFVIGFWLTPDDTFMTHSLQLRSNPKGVVRHTENFVGLSGSDVSCFPLFETIEICANPEFPYGTRILMPADSSLPVTPVSAFVHTPFTSVAVADSLPFMRYPGNFVDENSGGVLATTQISQTAQYGVLVRGTEQVTLADVPWLVAINDNPEKPLIIAYDGDDAGCLIYGTGCEPEPNACDYDPNPGHGGHRGRESSGHAWGHNKCKDGVVDGNNGGGNNRSLRGNTAVRVVAPPTPATGALLLQLMEDNSVTRYRFPRSVPLGIANGAATEIFPLAINNTRIVLRGDVTLGSTVYDKRLLSCEFDPESLDADNDHIVDCLGGLQLVGGIYNSIRAGTVLGFTLNNNDTLAGNFGYNASGVGMPMIVNLATVTPTAEVLSNLALGTQGWELNTITDMNRHGQMSGYGYKDCSLYPEAFVIEPLGSEPTAGVRFLRGEFEHPAYLPPRTVLPITPTMTGGSGAYEIRVHVKKPAETEWTLFADWTTSAGSWNPGDYQGEVCFRIEARDPSAPAATEQQTVVRYSVGVSEPPADDNTPGSDTGTEILTPTDGDYEVGDLLVGAVGGGSLLLLGVAGVLRRARRLR